MEPLVMVIWRDAHFDFDRGGVDDVDNLRDEYLVRTVGWVVSDGPKFLRIASEKLPDEDGHRAVTSIPLGIVVECFTLARFEDYPHG